MMLAKHCSPMSQRGKRDLSEAGERGSGMSEEMGAYMTTPNMNGDKRLPRRDGPRGLLPTTWLNRSLRVEYTGASGEAQQTSATLLDVYPFGPVLNIAGAKT